VAPSVSRGSGLMPGVCAGAISAQKLAEALLNSFPLWSGLVQVRQRAATSDTRREGGNEWQSS